MDQRTRERMPVLPALVAHVRTAAGAAAERLAAAIACTPDGTFTSGGETLRRAVTRHGSVGKIWAEAPATAKRRDLGLEEHRAFWSWAAVEVLRHTGVRIEELAELSHHSFVEYTVPASSEVIPLLHIVPSKTDTERLLVISPELADVLSVIIQSRLRRRRCSAARRRLRLPRAGLEPALPAVVPTPPRRRTPPDRRPTHPLAPGPALADSGLTDASGRSLHFTPHDFRRIFVTDAILHGMPPHIAQLVVGHREITTTMGYKAVYPEEAINSHRAFLARRRDLRPSEEYRVPTDDEWEEFLGHFERRKLALGTCGRSYTRRRAPTSTPVFAARCSDQTPPHAPASLRSPTICTPGPTRPDAKTGSARSPASRSPWPPRHASSTRWTNSQPIAAPSSTSACPAHPAASSGAGQQRS